MTNPIAAANQMSSERTVATLTYPLTGDTELDMVSGILAVLQHETPHVDVSHCVRVLQYLLSRYLALEKTIGTPPPIGQAYGQSPQWVPSHWTTTDGTQGYAQSLANLQAQFETPGLTR